MRSRPVLLAAVLAAAALLAIRRGGRFLVRDDPLPPAADAIVVLAGSVPDRALEAADLFASGVAPRVVITRERVPIGAAALRSRGIAFRQSDDILQDTLEHLGVPRTAIVRLQRRAVSTASEAAVIARWACRHGARRLVVVTSASHTRRAGMILDRSLGPAIDVAMRPSRYDRFPAARWWRSRLAAKRLLGEYQKLANYAVREHWAITPCANADRFKPRRLASPAA